MQGETERVSAGVASALELNVPAGERAPASAAAPRHWRAHLRLDRFEVLLLVVLVALSLWTLGLDLWQVLVHGRTWTGSENVYQLDGMQSMMWMQGIAHHGASPDLYVLGHSAADFFQPLLAISAALVALGAAPYIALLLWKPVALAGTFFLARAYVYRVLPGAWPRRAALTLALLFGWGAVIGDSWIVFWSWGYPFALIALACMVGALLAYVRARAGCGLPVAAPLLGALASWLHPWQGETLILVLVGSELVFLARGERVALRALLVTVLVSALPLLYFALLVHFDPTWQREREAALTTLPLSRIVDTLAPLALPALLAYRVRPRSFLALSARVWLLATVAVFLVSEWQGSGSTHALLGVTIPLAVLAVEGVCSLPWDALLRRAPLVPLAAVPLVALLIIPGTVDMLEYAQAHVKPRRGNANFISKGESAALSFLARDPRAGGVLTRFYLGVLVPPQTARQTYVGNCFWSEPNCGYRSETAERLLKGQLLPAQARAFVLATGARFVLADCRAHDLSGALAPISSEVRHFSCATVYVIR